MKINQYWIDFVLRKIAGRENYLQNNIIVRIVEMQLYGMDILQVIGE